MPTKRRGLFIVLEGIDGSGKTTQARNLVRRLRRRGFETSFFREPTRGRFGREIRRLAVRAGSATPARELALFVSDRKENVARNIGPALEAGRVVVLDRYYFSTMAYQGAKGLDVGRIRRLNEAFAIAPDLVIVLDVDARAGLARIAGRKRRDGLFEREDYLVRVRRIFRGLRGPGVVHLDGRRDRRAVGRAIWSCVEALLPPRPRMSLGGRLRSPR
ncbi:MAG TPA: dTMP kinase [Candidatus Aminicenantes bacterium]|nr:dTMP kinase [Candidatus Aminicenantes bacterium]